MPTRPLAKMAKFLLPVKNCCNLSVGVALNLRFTTNEMYAKNSTRIWMREQATIEWSRWVISIVACCHTWRSGFPIVTNLTSAADLKFDLVNRPNYCMNELACGMVSHIAIKSDSYRVILVSDL